MDKNSLTKVKCPQCFRTLLLAERFTGQIKCPRCKTITNFNVDQGTITHTVEVRE